MTGRETLFMFARLRGVQEQRIPGIVEGLMAALLFEEHADKLVKAYRCLFTYHLHIKEKIILDGSL